MDGDMQMIAIMQEFGWTYNEYVEQPQWVLDLVIGKITRDSKEQELAAKRANRGL